jgi:hypothetical protein
MKRLWVLIPALLFALVMVAFLPAKAENIHFTVVNNTVYPFESIYQPWPQTARGTMVPHIVLTDEGTGLRNDLNLRSQWLPEENYFTLFNNRGEYLTFVHRQNTAFSSTRRYTASIVRVIEGNSDIFFLSRSNWCARCSALNSAAKPGPNGGRWSASATR